MNRNDRFDLFISHATADRALAAALRDLICNALKLHQSRVFVSSDGKSLRLGVKDEPQIEEAHKSAKAVIALMTPRSIFRPWVIWETGAASFHAAKPLFVVLANGATVDCLPAPMQSWQAGLLTDRPCLLNLCESLGGVLGRNAVRLQTADTKRVIKLAAPSTGDWKGVNATLVAEKAAHSPFRLQNMLNDNLGEGAKQAIHILGQNLHIVTCGPDCAEFQKLLFDWLGRRDKSRRFTAVITDLRCRHEVATLDALFKNDFKGQLEASTKQLRNWVRKAKRLGLNLQVFVTPFVPMTATFVDPELESGYLVLTPILYEPAPTRRPHFIVGKRQNEAVFDYYWFDFQERIRHNPGIID